MFVVLISLKVSGSLSRFSNRIAKGRTCSL